MITIRKLSKLPAVSALRKSARLLQGFEIDLGLNKTPNPVYLKDLIFFITHSPELSQNEKKVITEITETKSNNKSEVVRICNSLRHLLLSHLNEEPADWDLLNYNESKDSSIKKESRKIFPFEIYLDDIRSPFNVGSIFRSSESFGVSKILLSAGTAPPTHRRALRTSMGCTDIIPWEISNCESFSNKNIFALELNGQPMHKFNFPESGIVIIGSEELGVSPECLKMADNSLGRVSIPIGGIKGSINVSVAFGILMHNWYNKTVGIRHA
jgi:RNA methyltransferase, TrmH family